MLSKDRSKLGATWSQILTPVAINRGRELSRKASSTVHKPCDRTPTAPQSSRRGSAGSAPGNWANMSLQTSTVLPSLLNQARYEPKLLQIQRGRSFLIRS